MQSRLWNQWLITRPAGGDLRGAFLGPSHPTLSQQILSALCLECPPTFQHLHCFHARPALCGLRASALAVLQRRLHTALLESCAVSLWIRTLQRLSCWERKPQCFPQSQRPARAGPCCRSDPISREGYSPHCHASLLLAPLPGLSTGPHLRVFADVPSAGQTLPLNGPTVVS